MSVRALSWAWRRNLGDRPGVKLLLAAIADQCGDQGVSWVGCTPRKLMEMSELSSSSFYRHRDLLQREGLLYVIPRLRTDGVKASSWFVLTMDLPAAYEHFEDMRKDGIVAENPLLPDGQLARPDTSPVTPAKASPVPGNRPTMGHENSPTMGETCPMVGGDSPTVGHHDSHHGTDPSRVDNGPYSPPSFPVLSEPPGRDVAVADPSAAENISERLLEHVASTVDPTIRDRDLPAIKWSIAAEQLVDADGHPLDEILELVEWATSDSFWATRVLCPADLRRHWTSILASRRRDRSGKVDVTRLQDRMTKLTGAAGACCLQPGAAPSEAEGEWARIAIEVRESIGGTTFDMWLGQAHAHVGADDELLLAVPEPAIGWVRDRLAPTIDRRAGRHIEIVCCEEATP